MALRQQHVAPVKDIADEFKTAKKAIANRSGMEQLPLAFQLAFISKEDMPDPYTMDRLRGILGGAELK